MQDLPGGPLAFADSATVKAGFYAKIEVLANDSAGSAPIDRDTLTIIGAPSHAREIGVNRMKVFYESMPDFVGTDSFTYQICDTAGACSIATVTITVTAAP